MVMLEQLDLVAFTTHLLSRQSIESIGSIKLSLLTIFFSIHVDQATLGQIQYFFLVYKQFGGAPLYVQLLFVIWPKFPTKCQIVDATTNHQSINNNFMEHQYNNFFWIFFYKKLSTSNIWMGSLKKTLSCFAKCLYETQIYPNVIVYI